MINLVWLKTFCTLVNVGHFTKTAETLFMTQSGVSQHIKKLEQHLATSLLIREGKSFSLTEAGLKLYQQGESLLKASVDIEVSIKEDDPFSGIVDIATPGSIGLKLYPHLLDIQQRHPSLIIKHAFAPNKSIERELIEHNIDIGLMTELSQSELIISEKVATEPLVLITPSEVKLINWQQLLQLGYIGHPDVAHHAQSLLSKNFAEFEQINQFELKGFSNQISLILEPVCRGLGFTVLPLHAVNAFHQQSRIKVHTLSQTVSENLYLCRNKRSYENNRCKTITSSIIQFISA